MAIINLNLKEIIDQDGLPAPEGSYVIRVASLPEKKKSKTSDNEVLKVIFKIVETMEGEKDIDGYNIAEKPIFHNLVLSSGHLGMPNGLKRLIVCLDLEDDFNAGNFNTDVMFDMTVGAEVGVKEYDGKKGNVINRFFTLGDN